MQPHASLDARTCYRALQARDARFDGRFFVGVVTTGIYCRPVCPAGPAKLENCRFFPSAAAAQGEGFRPCLRCRPETAVDLGSWRGTSNTVSRGLALIDDGALDAREGEHTGVDELAARLGVGERQLRRLFDEHLGASPIAVAQTRRILLAKQLIHETQLPMGEVALAAGFGSVRRFNETFRRMYGRAPSTLRRATPKSASPREPGVTLHLRHRPPYDWAGIVTHLRARRIDGVELIEDDRYRRTIALDGQLAIVSIADSPAQHSLAVTLQGGALGLLHGVVARVRRMFDLDADLQTIERHLARDPRLAKVIARQSGLRLPGAWDGFELAVRAVLGQQVTVTAARRLLSELVRRCGDAVDLHPPLTHVFPSPERVLAADLAGFPMPAARVRALHALSRLAHDEPELLRPGADEAHVAARLQTVDGIGEWTAHYVAMRSLRAVDAFPDSDVALLRSAAALGIATTRRELVARAERWRPWRAYAAQHLWTADSRRKRGE